MTCGQSWRQARAGWDRMQSSGGGSGSSCWRSFMRQAASCSRQQRGASSHSQQAAASCCSNAISISSHACQCHTLESKAISQGHVSSRLACVGLNQAQGWHGLSLAPQCKFNTVACSFILHSTQGGGLHPQKFPPAAAAPASSDFKSNQQHHSLLLVLVACQ